MLLHREQEALRDARVLERCVGGDGVQCDAAPAVGHRAVGRRRHLVEVFDAPRDEHDGEICAAALAAARTALAARRGAARARRRCTVRSVAAELAALHRRDEAAVNEADVDAEYIKEPEVEEAAAPHDARRRHTVVRHRNVDAAAHNQVEPLSSARGVADDARRLPGARQRESLDGRARPHALEREPPHAAAPPEEAPRRLRERFVRRFRARRLPRRESEHRELVEDHFDHADDMEKRRYRRYNPRLDVDRLRCDRTHEQIDHQATVRDRERAADQEKIGEQRGEEEEDARCEEPRHPNEADLPRNHRAAASRGALQLRVPVRLSTLYSEPAPIKSGPKFERILQ